MHGCALVIAVLGTGLLGSASPEPRFEVFASDGLNRELFGQSSGRDLYLGTPVTGSSSPPCTLPGLVLELAWPNSHEAAMGCFADGCSHIASSDEYDYHAN